MGNPVSNKNLQHFVKQTL